MRFKVSLTLVLFVLLAAALIAPAGAQDQQSDQKIIDDFVTTRGVSFEEPGKPKPKPTTQQSANNRKSGGTAPAKRTGANTSGGSTAAGKKGSAATTSDVASSKKKPAASKGASKESDSAAQAAGPGADTTSAATTLKASATKGQPKAIGLGYTLFIKEGENILSADLGREFREGDKIRVALETNTDGYLYIFHTENGLKPQMLFPHAQIDGGANAIVAHARDFVPADMKTWFEFDNMPATERLYIVVSRQPLAGVPAGDELVEFCGGAREGCYWKPSQKQWDSIKAGSSRGRVLESKNAQLASLQTPVPSNSLSRGLKVKKDEPAPAVVRVNDSPTADVLVTTIDLVHK
ncbi:MAG: DUF4384 domain-containing protein [Acidobacteria bacterium]|nr:DUF4384 domain-containing protein [Acidobacteriota bacterium]